MDENMMQTMDDFDIEIVDDDPVEIDVEDTDLEQSEPEAEQPKPTVEPKGDLRVALKKERELRKQERERNERLEQMLMARLAGEEKKEPEIDPDLATLKSGDYDPNLTAIIEKLYAKVSSTTSADHAMKLEVQLLESKYPGISDHADDVVRLAKQKGLTPEEAYLAKWGKELLTRSRDDVLREMELRSANTTQGTARVSADGNAAQDPAKKRETVKLTKSQAAVLQSLGVAPSAYAQAEKVLASSNGVDIATLSAIFGKKGGSKKG
jgi:hypothetical protein